MPLKRHIQSQQRVLCASTVCEKRSTSVLRVESVSRTSMKRWTRRRSLHTPTYTLSNSYTPLQGDSSKEALSYVKQANGTVGAQKAVFFDVSCLVKANIPALCLFAAVHTEEACVFPPPRERKFSAGAISTALPVSLKNFLDQVPAGAPQHRTQKSCPETRT